MNENFNYLIQSLINVSNLNEAFYLALLESILKMHEDTKAKNCKG